MNYFEMLKSLELDLPTVILYTITIYLSIAMFKYFQEHFNKEYDESILRYDKIIDLLLDIKDILQNEINDASKKEKLFRKSVEVGKLTSKNEYKNIQLIINKENSVSELVSYIESNINYRRNIVNYNNSFIGNVERFINESRLKVLIKAIGITITILYFSLFFILGGLSIQNKPFMLQLESFAAYGLFLSFLISFLGVAEVMTLQIEKKSYVRLTILSVFTMLTPIIAVMYFGNSQNQFDGFLFVIVDLLYFLVIIKMLKRTKNFT